MESLKILLLCVLAAIVYGICHDQVTARICVEYFTIGHPPIFASDSPTLLAFGWGIIATWWVGMILGIPALLTCRIGSWPKFGATDLLRPLVVLLCVMAISSLLMGIIGYCLAKTGTIWLIGPLASLIPPSKHNVFLANAWAHCTAYGVGVLGGIVICGRLVWLRFQKAKTTRDAKASPNAP